MKEAGLLADKSWQTDGADNEEWSFRIGQCVSHKDQPLPSLVMDRVLTSKGREIYGIRSFAWNDERRDRMILGEYLVDVKPGSRPCVDCLLFNTDICPGK